PPGCSLRFSDGRAELRRWYQQSGASPSRPFDANESISALRETMDVAVAQRLVADVPVGAFLSSGIDSAIVASTMARHQSNVRTFTIGFDGVPDYYEERPGARDVARHIAASHTEIVVKPTDALSILDNLFTGLDEPFADSSAVASFIVAREARRHVK